MHVTTLHEQRRETRIQISFRNNLKHQTTTENNTQIAKPIRKSRPGSCVMTNVPRILTARLHIKIKILAPASTIPAGLAFMEFLNCPLTNQLKLVVNPQCGQLTPDSARNVQGGIPSCSCVPNPRGSGLSHTAMPKTTTIPTPDSSVNRRCVRVKARRVCGLESDIVGRGIRPGMFPQGASGP